MDSLDNLPTNETTKSTPQEEEVLKTYFGEPSSQQSSGSSNQKSLLMQVGYASVIFVALNNPLTDLLLEKIPKIGDNKLFMYAVKVLLFALIFFIVLKYA